MFHRLGWLLAAAFLFGCSCTSKKPAPHGGELPDIVHIRVISLSPNITELVSLVGAEQKLVGRTAWCDYPNTPQIREVPILANPAPDVEKIIVSQPDLILADASLINPSYVKKFEDAKIKTVVLEINTLTQWVNALQQIGNLLLAQRTASEAIDEVRAVMHLGTTDPVNPKPKVLVAMGANQPMVAGLGSFQADVMRSAGGEAVGPDAKKFVPVSPEQIVNWNPDMIFVPGDAAAYYKSAAFSATNAAKRGLIIGIEESYLLRAGARLEDLIRATHAEMMKAAGR